MRQNGIRHNNMRHSDRKHNGKCYNSFSKCFFIIFFGIILSYFMIQYIEAGTISNTIKSKLSSAFLFFIFYLIIIWIKKALKKRRLLKSDIYDVDEMSGTDFELMLYYYFKNLGYKVKLTPITHDFGADLILRHKKSVTVVQAKRWNESVGIKAVQEVVGAIRYYHADEAMVITNSFYTKSAKQLAIANDVILYDRRTLITLIEDNILEEQEDHYSMKEQEKLYCPFCNSQLVLRSGHYGKFYGCSNYPTCKYTRNV